MLPVSSTQVANFAAGINDTSGIGDQFAAGVVDTCGKFAKGVVYTDGKFAIGVIDTGGMVANLPLALLIPVVHLDLQISPQICEKI